MLRLIAGVLVVTVVLVHTVPVRAQSDEIYVTKRGVVWENVKRAVPGPTAWRAAGIWSAVIRAFGFVGMMYLPYVILQLAYELYRAGAARRPPENPPFPELWEDVRGGSFFRIQRVNQSGCGPLIGGANAIRVTWSQPPLNINGYSSPRNLCFNPSESAVWAVAAEMHQIWQAQNGGPQSSWPGTTDPLPGTLAAAAADPRWPTIQDEVAAKIPQAITQVVPTPHPPVSIPQYAAGGITFVPDPRPYWTGPGEGPGPMPTPGAPPTPGPAPTPAPPPGPGEPPVGDDDPLTKNYLRSIMVWLMTQLQALAAWAMTAARAIAEWMVAEVARLVEYAVQELARQIGWLNDQITYLVADIAERLLAIETAIRELPAEIAADIEQAVTSAVTAAFVPQTATLEQFTNLRTALDTKPPFSLLPPASMFPDVGGGGCSLPSPGAMTIQAGGASGTVVLEWPSFVCDLAGVLRGFLLGMFWVAIAWTILMRLLPTVTV